MNENEAFLVLADGYSRMARTYDERVAPKFEPMARRMVDRAGPKPGELVLDVSTGTGLTACLASPRVEPGGQVVAIDLADGALAVASERAAARKCRNIRWEMMDSRNIVYHNDLFDAVVCSFGLPNLQPEAVLSQVARVLKPSGRFSLVDWADHVAPSSAAFAEVLERHRVQNPDPELAASREAARMSREAPRRKDVSTRTGLAALLRDAGFRDVDIVEADERATWLDAQAVLDFFVSWGSVDAEVAAMSSDARRAFRDEATAKLDALAGPDGIAADWKVLYVLARP